jgi:dTDP-4-amino-4,6-dideoxygalactose transaminase
VDKYSWVDTGSSYLPADILAALLLSQLEARDAIQGRRRQIWDEYENGLRDWAAVSEVRLPIIPPQCNQSYHMFYLLLPSPNQREALIAHLKVRGIMAVFHYLPLHLSTYAERWGGKVGDCPVAESVSDRLLRLPFYFSLSEMEQKNVIEAIQAFQPRSRE